MQRADALLVVTALALISGGVGLAAMGTGYVAGWIGAEQQLRAVPPIPACGLCPQRIVQFLPMPDPRPVFLAYLLAMPLGMTAGFLLNREGRRERGRNPPHGAILRMTGGVIAGSLIGMAVFYLAAAVMGATLGPQDPNVLRPVYFVGLLVVPSLIIGAGGTLLAEGASVGLTAQRPSARE